eukprot:Gb_33193 [translate_table: standard]
MHNCRLFKAGKITFLDPAAHKRRSQPVLRSEAVQHWDSEIQKEEEECGTEELGSVKLFFIGIGASNPRPLRSKKPNMAACNISRAQSTRSLPCRKRHSLGGLISRPVDGKYSLQKQGW